MVLGRRFKLYFILCVWNIMAAAGNDNGNRPLWMPEGNLPPPPPDMRPSSQIRNWIIEAAREFSNSDNNTRALLDVILKKLLDKAENDELLKEAIGLKQNINYKHFEIKDAAKSYFRQQMFISRRNMVNQLKSTIRAGRRKHRTRRNRKQRKQRKHRTRKH